MATQFKICLLVVMTGIVMIVALAVRGTEGAKDDSRFDAAKLKDGALWSQVNAEPYHITPAVAALCAPGVLAGPGSQTKVPISPHEGTYITVYVNKIGREAMFAKAMQHFPQGSIIVKEKFKTESEPRKPILYTLMKKRERGYNPEVGDWEFSVVGPDGKQVQETGKLENCESCHRSQSDTDFVYRPYVKFQ